MQALKIIVIDGRTAVETQTAKKGTCMYTYVGMHNIRFHGYHSLQEDQSRQNFALPASGFFQTLQCTSIHPPGHALLPSVLGLALGSWKILSSHVDGVDDRQAM